MRCPPSSTAAPTPTSTRSSRRSCPRTHLPLLLNMACTLFRMTPAEALLGVTRHAARALGLQASHGTIAVGKRADLCLWDAESPAALSYAIAASPLRRRLQDGREQPL